METIQVVGPYAELPFRSGAVLIDAAATIHTARNGKRSPIDYYFKLDAVGWIQVSGTADGQAVRFKGVGSPEPGYAMDEYGDVTLESVRGAAPFNAVVNTPLTRWEWIVVSTHDAPIGVRFAFGERHLLIFAWGDELVAATRLPKYLRDADARFVQSSP